MAANCSHVCTLWFRRWGDADDDGGDDDGGGSGGRGRGGAGATGRLNKNRCVAADAFDFLSTYISEYLHIYSTFSYIDG